MANSTKKCKHCLGWFSAAVMIKTPRGTFCTMTHAIEFARKESKRKAEKERKAKHREDLRRVRRNPKAEALKAAQMLARISNADDDGYCTCVTCGHVGKWNDGFDGGHFIAKGNCSYWMLDPRNIHPQCKACNGNGMKYGGKLADYTTFMIDEYGRDFVEHMKAMRSTVIKRSAKYYDDFTEKAKAEIAEHKKRINS